MDEKLKSFLAQCDENPSSDPALVFQFLPHVLQTCIAQSLTRSTTQSLTQANPIELDSQFKAWKERKVHVSTSPLLLPHKTQTAQSTQEEIQSLITAKFSDFWQCQRVNQDLADSVRHITDAFKEMKHASLTGESVWAALDTHRSNSMGEKANSQVVMEILESKMEDFNLVDDELFLKLEVPGNAANSIVTLFTTKLQQVRLLLEKVDRACLKLTRCGHPESQAYYNRYTSFRAGVCNLIKSIICHTFERTEAHLSTQIQASQTALQKAIDNLDYLDRLTKVATAPETIHETVGGDPLGFRYSSDSNTFVPARWFYIKFRSYGVNILPITQLLAERAAATDLDIYSDTLSHLGGVYAAFRIRFLSKSFQRQIVHLISQQREGLDLACRQASTFWLSVANYEIDIFKAYFGQGAHRYVQPSLVSILQALGDCYCDALRPYVLKCRDFAILKDVYDCLSVDILDVEATEDRSMMNEQAEMNILKFGPIHRILGDLQESLLFRIEAFIAKEIKEFDYSAHRDCLNYPAILYECQSDEERREIYTPPTKQAVYCLSKLRSVLNSKVLKSVANELIASALEKLMEAVKGVSSNTNDSLVESRLFALREALHLRDCVQSNQLAISSSVHRILSFDKLRMSIRAIFGGVDRTRLGRFLSSITPELKDEEFDSKESLNNAIDTWIQELTSFITAACIKPLLDFFDAQEKPDLSTVLGEFWDVCSSMLGSYLISIGLYLLNVPKLISKCPTFEEISEEKMVLDDETTIRTKKISLESKRDLFMEPIRVAIGEAYRQFLRKVEPAQASKAFSINKVDNLVYYYAANFRDKV
eukprot:Blabericola_migrator_1__7936@NODE_406_length_8824_cov_44_431426_g320_i0_p2_GENE_NODE_406_length_8824_cov_44_431426_g320_i0NODE_406_length_8824_cov_44_431426_g320_i0_p2_ORF_typecomplete_len821_score177_71Sec34/PF04136_15/0_038Sec34/PF04136_15/8_3e02PMEI/PF04043_15/3_8e02PMEI/PF04043_15/1_4e04PMEI/PF04043_15/0_34T3SS_needle_F/PF09392_10/1_2e03T3SS_needle_F/PF09392_10/1_9e02T3SS_needle_F/PF09392_10/45_NODE_406_length_8824_cov_44_431426_g320_i058028264